MRHRPRVPLSPASVNSAILVSSSPPPKLSTLRPLPSMRSIDLTDSDMSEDNKSEVSSSALFEDAGDTGESCFFLLWDSNSTRHLDDITSETSSVSTHGSAKRPLEIEEEDQVPVKQEKKAKRQRQKMEEDVGDLLLQLKQDVKDRKVYHETMMEKLSESNKLAAESLRLQSESIKAYKESQEKNNSFHNDFLSILRVAVMGQANTGSSSSN